MKINIYLIVILLLIILICSCLTNIKIKKITENYVNNSKYILHNDRIQNMSIDNIRTKINKNTYKINNIENNNNNINKNINKIKRENNIQKQRLLELIKIAEEMESLN
jgi:septal ring factor EnvC (AmiA/AmiB activator)